jgi:chromate reductase, NAD(P)H dehydrogenase (quinone)
MRVLLMGGSLRSASYNRRLLDVIANQLYGLCEIDILYVSDVNLPFCNEDLEHDAFLKSQVMRLHSRFDACHGMILASPEYNGQINASLKNTIDWVSRLSYLEATVSNPFLDKPVLLTSATTGYSAGLLGLEHLAALMRYVGGLVMAGSISIAHAHNVFDGAGAPDHSVIDNKIEAPLERFLHLVSRLHPVPSQEI